MRMLYRNLRNCILGRRVIYRNITTRKQQLDHEHIAHLNEKLILKNKQTHAHN